MHASVGLADVWTVLERGLLLDRLKRARRRDPRRKERWPGVGRDFDTTKLASFINGYIHRGNTSSSSYRVRSRSFVLTLFENFFILYLSPRAPEKASCKSTWDADIQCNQTGNAITFQRLRVVRVNGTVARTHIRAVCHCAIQASARVMGPK